MPPPFLFSKLSLLAFFLSCQCLSFLQSLRRIQTQAFKNLHTSKSTTFGLLLHPRECSEKINHFKIKQARLSNQGSGLSNFLFAFHRSCVSNSSSHGAQPGLQIRIFEKLFRHVHGVLFHVELVSHLFHQPRFCHQDAGFYISSQMLIPVVPHKAVAEVSKIGNL